MEFIAILIRGFFCLHLTDYDFLRKVNQNQSLFLWISLIDFERI